MATLVLQNLISQSSSKGGEQNILETKYGDGYTQTAAWGINATRDKWGLQWAALYKTERDQFWTFFNTVGLYDVWDWQAPGDSTVKQWRFTEYPTESINAGLYSISAPCTQEFRL